LNRSGPGRRKDQMPRPFASLRRLAPSTFMVIAVALVLAASAAALFVVYDTGERIILQRERAEALAERDLLLELDQEQGVANLVSSVARRSRFSAGGERYGLFSETNAPLAGDIGAYIPAFTDADWRKVRIGGVDPANLHVATTIMPDGTKLVVGRDLSNIRQFERAIIEGFLSALAIVVVASLVAGYILNARMLRRVDAIAATAERIAAGDLSARTPVDDPHDPFGRVGASLNTMLERIEDLMTGMRTVTDSLAHDLRSPLTRMKGALARALYPHATEAERLDAIEDAHGQVDHTLATLSAMLDIARAETGLSRDMMRQVDVAALTDEVADFFAPIIEDAGQTLLIETGEAPIVAPAHEALLRQAIGNLLHNAALYAGEGANVCARVEGLGDRVEITVSDTGLGVSEDQRGRMHERFVRLDPARGAGGSGLGLAIATACAKLHGGELRLLDNSPGLKAVLEIARSG
jgi:signal transduction histidine kinase